MREPTIVKEDPPSTGSIPEARGFDIQTPSIQSHIFGAEPRARENIPSLYKSLKLGHFSGQEPLAKDEVPYEHWAYKVQSNRIVCAENVLRQGIIQSLRGDAARLVWSMGPNALIDDI